MRCGFRHHSRTGVARPVARFLEAYDSALVCASSDHISVGSSTTRVNDFVNRGPEFDALYVYEPVLEACRRIIGQPFKLSTMHARTVRPYSQAQNLHVDFKGDADGWPMIGFILMVDEFRTDNGATRFVPGSHKWSTISIDFPKDTSADYEGQVLAYGPAGWSLSTTGPSGTDTPQTGSASPGVQYRAPISDAMQKQL